MPRFGYRPISKIHCSYKNHLQTVAVTRVLIQMAKSAPKPAPSIAVNRTVPRRWENFERLCYRLAGRAERVEYVSRYGRLGQAHEEEESDRASDYRLIEIRVDLLNSRVNLSSN